jgi:septum site-determining protein MinD
MATPPKTITLFGPKGGAGVTTLTINLAVALREQHRLPAVVLELPGMDDEELRLWGSQQLPLVPAAAANGALSSVITKLGETCQFILIDAGSELHAPALAALEHANLILLVMTPDVVSLHRTLQMIQRLETLRVPLRMVKVVLNRAESHGNFRSSQIRQSLPIDVIAEIPSDGRTASLALNQGTSVVQAAPKSRLSVAILDWARFLVTTPQAFIEHVVLDRSKLPAPVAEALPVRSLGTDPAIPDAVPIDPLLAVKKRIHGKLVEKLDLKRMDLGALKDARKARELRARVEQVILDLLVSEQGFMSDPEQRRRLMKELVDDFLGLGPLEDLMADAEVSDILVNGSEMVYVEKRGKLYLTDKKFISNDQVLTIIERIIAPLGRRVDESTPMVDARLPDGSRVNAVISPLSIKGPMLSIRKFGRRRYMMEDLLGMSSLSPAMAEFLRICVETRRNIIVSGGTGSGKTTMLNVLSACIPDGERIVTIEDAAELRLMQRHWVALESRMPNIEGKGEVTVRQLFRNTLRMRPDRVIIGECRGEETLDMLQAMNTGHDGSLTTLHANSPQDVISRLDTLVLMSNVDLPVRAIREQIVAAIDVIVHTARMTDGTRKVTHISEIIGMDERLVVTFHDLFVFEQTGVDQSGKVLGQFRPTGVLPTFLADLKSKGVVLDPAMFQP